MSLDLSGAGAIVFGGASGLGAATARRLASAGADVMIGDVDDVRSETLGAEIGARWAHVDITDATSIDAALTVAAEAPLGLRVAVVCAGLGLSARLLGRDGPTEQEHFEKVIGVNLLGTINAIRLAAAQMADNAPDDDGQRGVCVQTASVAAFDGQIGQVAYAASKGGVVALTLPVARELARIGVRVMTIAPGIFDTPMLGALSEPVRRSLAAGVPFPQRLGRPDEYAALVAHIVENSMLNGEVIRLDASLRMAPR